MPASHPHTDRHIEVRVSPQGEITVGAHGHVGRSCEEATAFLERALGLVRHRRRTADYHRGQRRTSQASEDQTT
jgi:hypothetical protein